MSKTQQPEYYPLEHHMDADFWGPEQLPPRRTFLMPLPVASEFLAFGVRGPSQEVLFVARGRVIVHLGAFIDRMKEAGSSVELYRRAPVPAEILRLYVKDDGHEQKECEAPPQDPPLQPGDVVLRGSEDAVSISSTTNLWASMASFTVTQRKVVVQQIPNLEQAEYLAFGLAEVFHPKYRWSVAFVARVNTSQPSFLDENGQAIPTSSTNPPAILTQYMTTHFGSAPQGMTQPEASARASGQSYKGALA